MGEPEAKNKFTLSEACDFFGVSNYVLRKWMEETRASLGDDFQPRQGDRQRNEKGTSKILSCQQMLQIALVRAPNYVARLRRMCQAGDEWLERVYPTNDYVWYTTYPDQLPIVLDVLNNSCLNEPARHVLLMVGLKGSPKRDMAKAIADYLLLPADSRSGRRSLLPYRSVYMLDCRKIVTAMVDFPELDADAVINRIRGNFTSTLESPSERVVLVLDPVHFLLREAPTERLWRVLAAATDIAVVGALDPNEDERALNRLEDTSPLPVETVNVNKTTLEDTYRFLRSHHYPEWQNQGFAFEENAFDHVIALEPGARVNDKRMTLPYLAFEVGQQTINRVGDGGPGADVLGREFARALRHIEELLSSKNAQEQLVPILQSAKDEITKAAAGSAARLQPQPSTGHSNQSVKLLTRAHVTAQLLSSGGSTFRWEDISSN